MEQLLGKLNPTRGEALHRKNRPPKIFSKSSSGVAKANLWRVAAAGFEASLT